MLYALQHIGLAIPPQADTYWVGEAGPGPSYLDADGGGQHNAWTTRNTVFMTWNMLHLARMLKDAGGIPAYGNSTRDWDLGQPRSPEPRPPRSAKPTTPWTGAPCYRFDPPSDAASPARHRLPAGY